MARTRMSIRQDTKLTAAGRLGEMSRGGEGIVDSKVSDGTGS